MIQKMREASTLLFDCNSDTEFYNVIIQNQSIFDDFKIIFCPKNTNLLTNSSNLLSFRSQYSFLHLYFPYNNLVFFSKEKIQELMLNGSNNVPATIYFTIDSNVAKALYDLKEGKQPSPKEKTLQLIDIATNKKISFDDNFFRIENLCELKDENNDRPIQTIKAIQAINKLTSGNDIAYSPLDIDVKNFTNNDQINELFTQRRGIYLLLLKTYLSFWHLKEPIKVFKNVYEYSIRVLNKFAKNELYYVWKFINNPSKSVLFQPPLSKQKNTLKHIRKISGDLFFIRYSEQLSKFYSNDVFSIPMYISFDELFFSWLDICPVKFVIFNPNTGAINTCFEDEYSFQEFMYNEILKAEEKDDFKNAEIESRWKNKLNNVVIEDEIKLMEKEINEKVLP